MKSVAEGLTVCPTIFVYGCHCELPRGVGERGEAKEALMTLGAAPKTMSMGHLGQSGVRNPGDFPTYSHCYGYGHHTLSLSCHRPATVFN